MYIYIKEEIYYCEKKGRGEGVRGNPPEKEKWTPNYEGKYQKEYKKN